MKSINAYMHVKRGIGKVGLCDNVLVHYITRFSIYSVQLDYGVL